MSILGELIIKLSANTASFIEGMTGASKTARKVGGEIEDSFGRLGSVAATALAPLGEFGSFLSQTLTGVGESAGTAITALGKLGGGIAPLAVGLGAVAGAATAVTLASVALATHTAETIAKIGELSQSTGVSVEALSALGFAGKEVGLDIDTVAKSLEKMDKAVFKAATSPAGTASAFSRLGISIREANGQLRGTEEIFTDLAERFANMPDGVAKTAHAIEIFGRGGAALVPLLNQGKDGIQEFVNTAQALGVVLDEKTASAAEKFKEDLAAIEAAGQGVAIRLTKDLLPALDFLAAKLVTSFKTGEAQKLIDLVANLAKVTLGVGDTFFAVFEQIGILLEGLGGTVIAVFNAIGAGIEAVAKAGVGDFSGARASLKDGLSGLKQETDNFIQSSKKAWADNAAFINGIFSATLPQARPRGGAGTTGDTAAEEADKRLAAIKKLIAELAAQTNADLNLAAASAQSVAVQRLLRAEGEANLLLTKLQAEADRTAGAERQKLTAFIRQQAGAIRALELEKQAAKDATSLNSELQKETEAYDAQITSLGSLAIAYALGGSAIAAAGIDKQLEADRIKVATLAEEYDLLAQKPGVTAEALGKLSIALNAANAKLEQHRVQLEQIQRETISVELNKQADAFSNEKPALQALNAAYLENSDSVRRAQQALALYNFEQAHPGATLDQIRQATELIKEQSDVAYAGAIAQAAAQYDVNVQYQNEIIRLNDIRDLLVRNGQSTIQVDAQIYEANRRMIQQWDDAALKVGTFGEKTRAVLNEIALEGQDAGKKIADSILSAYDNLTTELAKLATGQKTNFKQVFQGLAEQITKAEIQKGIGAITEKFGIKIPGLAARADGSSSNPFHVIIANQGPGGTATSAGGIFPDGGRGKGILGGIGGLLDGLFHKNSLPFEAGGGPTAIPGVIGAVGKNFSFGQGGLESLFPGLAGGGDMSPGKWYMTGEKGIEFMKGPGTVIPADKMPGKSGPTIHQTNNFNLSQPVDLFRKPGSQLLGNLHRTASMAYARGK